jgi:translin
MRSRRREARTAILAGEPLPAPEEVGIDNAAYLCGLAEAAGELRRRVLDILRHGRYEEAERLMSVMDDIYGLLVTMDFPDALTGNLRRITDMVRGVVERTRGDLTTTSQQEDLKRTLRSLEEKLPRP